MRKINLHYCHGLIVVKCREISESMITEIDGMITMLSNTCFLGNPVSVVMQRAVEVLVLFAPFCAQCGRALPVHAANRRGRQSVT